MAVGDDGTGHVVWMTDEAGDRVGYCRVPRNGSACDGASTVLAFPGGAAAVGAQTPQVFAPAPRKVVIVGGCFSCNPSGATDRVFRWISTDNGSSFGAPAEVGANLRLDGQGTYVDAGDVFAGVERHQLLGTPVSGSPAPVEHAPSGFAFGGAVIRVPGADQLVAVANDLDTVRFHVYAGPLDGAAISTAGNWPVTVRRGGQRLTLAVAVRR